ncbi:MAG: periplasmic heavy metal sensor [Arhodomonas sp.]|nr:periplasmic heavy metal sensor [Arhodomonas sp.]
MMGQGMGPGMMGQGMGPGIMGPGMMMGQRNISAEDKARLTELRKGHMNEQFDLMQQMQEKRFALAGLYREAAPDPEAVGKAYTALADVQRQMLENCVAFRNEMQGLLKPDQGSGMHGMSGGQSE